jgi:hypothetical protein
MLEMIGGAGSRGDATITPVTVEGTANARLIAILRTIQEYPELLRLA